MEIPINPPHWTETNIVDLSLLNDMDNPDRAFQMSQRLEENIGRDFAISLGTTVEAVSLNFAPEYDIKLKDSSLLEIKSTLNGGLKFFIETGTEIISKGNKAYIIKSGLSLSESDYYVFGQKYFKKLEYKIKSVLTEDLKEEATTAEIIRHPSDNSKLGFWIDFKEFAGGFDAYMGTYTMLDEKRVKLDSFTFHKGKDIVRAKERHKNMLINKKAAKVLSLAKHLLKVPI